MESPIQSIMAALTPMMPKKQPIKNPVSEFLANLLTEKYGDTAETELLHLVLVNSANDDPNKVLYKMVDLHDRIGVFITGMNNGAFDDWIRPPEESPEVQSAVLELP